MSHATTVQNHPGVDPWRSAGGGLPESASPAEVLEAANFFDVEERAVHILPGDVQVTDKKALVRADNGKYLATVGRGYAVVQYRSVFKTIIDAGAEVQVRFRAFGTFAGGARAWMLGELPLPIVVRGDESPMKKYILAVAGHDGATAVLLKNTALRIWCSNSIGAALGSAGGLWRVHHTRAAPKRLEEVARGIRVVHESFTRLGELANQLAISPFTSMQMATVAKTLLPIADDGHDHTRTHHSREKLMDLFENGVGITSSMRGTAWAAANAAVEFYDHHRPVRGSAGESGPARRLESAWLGAAASKKEAAMQLITEAVGVRLAA
jgi:phage/plasmid-like protein (TIGR03299 family)